MWIRKDRVLNIFYEEPATDRWLPFDRYARRIIRRLIRGKPRPGGHTRVFLNLCAGLDSTGTRYRVNDYRYANSNPAELVCIIGQPFVLDKNDWKNPILFGPAGYSHPIDDPDLLERRPIRKILVAGPWMKHMCEPSWGNAVDAWPVGIDTAKWQAPTLDEKEIDVLIYDKIRWEHDSYDVGLIEPIRTVLKKLKNSFREIRYGFYREEDFHAALCKCKTMIFLCEHETQGIAYQQALSCGIPIMAWDRGGLWRDPSYFPGISFGPVSSVPYWDERCGTRFADVANFEEQWAVFWTEVQRRRFRPRDYVLENLTLEKCAQDYVEIANSCLT